MARLAEKGPTVLVLEDLHWADPISVRLTEELAALAGDGPLLLLATRRPDPDPGVSGLESSLEADARCPMLKIELSPLPEEAERALARSLIGPGASEAVIEAACTGVEGNPLFLEERLSSLVETGALLRDEIHLAPPRQQRHRGPGGVGAPHPGQGGPARPAAQGGHHLCLGHWARVRPELRSLRWLR